MTHHDEVTPAVLLQEQTISEHPQDREVALLKKVYSSE